MKCTLKYPIILMSSMLIINNVYAYTHADLTCLTHNMYWEAHHENDIGMLAVGSVTLNRVKSDKFPNTICGVVKEKNQFSWYVPNKPKKIVYKHLFKRANNLALMLLKNQIKIDLTLGSTFFHATYVKKHLTKWFKNNLDYTITINKHMFYKMRSTK